MKRLLIFAMFTTVLSFSLPVQALCNSGVQSLCSATRGSVERVSDRVEQVDQEDHRAVGGSYDSGKLTINTQDMDGGSKRTFEVTGFDAESKANTTAISNVHNKVTNNTQNIAATNQRIDGVMNDMRYMDRNLSAGIASSIAIGQHQFDPSFKGGQVSLSGGFYNGQNAVSLAVGVPVGERAFFSASIASDSGSYGESGGVGVTIRLP